MTDVLDLDSVITCGCPFCAAAPAAVLAATDGGPAAAPVNLTVPQIAQGLLYADLYWSPAQFTFSVPGTTAAWAGYVAGSEPFVGYRAFSAAQATQFRAAIALWDGYVAPNFTETNDATAPGNVRAAFSGLPALNGLYGYAYGPAFRGGATTAVAGDVWLNDDYVADNFLPGDYSWNALLHEIGHTLGLKHTFEAPAIAAAYDNRRFSLMSYADFRDSLFVNFIQTGNAVDFRFTTVFASTPMVLDIAAVQSRYGADPATAAGDSVYVFDQAQPLMRAIYDAGGVDVIDLGSFTRGSVVDLTPGSYSSIGRWSAAEQQAYWLARLPAYVASSVREAFAGSNVYTWTDNLGLAFTTVIENVIGGSAADQINGNAAVNTLDGRAGDDFLAGQAGDDKLYGGLDRDTLFGNSGSDVLLGQEGDDTLDGGEDGDFILGGAGADVAYGGAGVDLLGGEDGDDKLYGGADGDNLYGGAGFDIVMGEDGNDLIDGGDGGDYLLGGLGGDTLYGGQGVDLLGGEDGNDALYGGADGDNLYGAAGTDAIFGDDGDDFVDAGADGDFVLGGAGNDRLYGSAGVDLLGGEDGADQLFGGDGGDNLYGGASNDVVFGEQGADYLAGQDGDDVLGGGGGADRLNGGAGNDRYIFFGGDGVPGEVDIIEDFASGFDIIDVSFIDADSALAGDQAFVYAGFSSVPTGAGTMHLGFIQGVGIFLFGYIDGDANPDLLINIGTFAVTGADLIL